MKNIYIAAILYSFVITSQIQAEIPEAIKNDINLRTASYIKVPFLSYFSDEQKKLIEQNFIDLIMEYFYNSANLTSFSREELEAFVRQQFAPLFIEKVTLPKPISLKALRNNIIEINRLDSGNKPRSESKEFNFIPSPWNKERYLMQLRFKNGTLPILITPMGNGQINIELYGIPFLRGRSACLDINFILPTKKFRIEWLGTINAVCPLVAEKKGSYLLEFAEAIAKALGVEKIRLLDASSVKCRENKKEVELGPLKIFQQGKTWYESHGYAQKPTLIEEYRRHVEALRKYKIEELETNIEQVYDSLHSSFKNLNDKQQKYYNYLNLIKPNLLIQLNKYKKDTDNDLVVGFMAWLYQQNCASYTEIFDLLFPKKRFKITPVLFFAKLYPKDDYFYKQVR
jgi:hypothetical protein